MTAIALLGALKALGFISVDEDYCAHAVAAKNYRTMMVMVVKPFKVAAAANAGTLVGHGTLPITVAVGSHKSIQILWNGVCWHWQYPSGIPVDLQPICLASAIRQVLEMFGWVKFVQATDEETKSFAQSVMKDRRFLP